MSQTYARHGGTKEAAIQDARRSIWNAVSKDHPQHRVEWLRLEGDKHELWCCSCEELIASAEIGEAPE